VKLAKQVGEPVDVLANGKLIARGELVVLDSALAVRITDVVDGRDSHG
jgi:flagellar motor switch protein FliN/FliY